MSREALRTVSDQIRSYREGNADGANVLFDPHAVVDMSRLTGPGEVAYGLAEINRLVGGFRASFDTYDYETAELVDAGGNTIVAVIHEHGRGRASGVPVDRVIAVVYNVIGGKITRVTGFPTMEEALEAVGLSE